LNSNGKLRFLNNPANVEERKNSWLIVRYYWKKTFFTIIFATELIKKKSWSHSYSNVVKNTIISGKCHQFIQL